MLTHYTFSDPDPSTSDGLTDVRAVKPLPDGLLDPRCWDIPAARRLSDLTEDRTNAEAFELWASELLGIAEFAQHCLPIDDLTDVVASVNAQWYAAVGSIPEIEAHRRALLRPFIVSAMTLRQVAAACYLPLSEIVGAFFSTNVAHKAEQYAELEERIIAGDLSRFSARHLEREYGVGDEKVVFFADRHGVDRDAARAMRAKPSTLARRARAAARAVQSAPDLAETVAA